VGDFARPPGGDQTRAIAVEQTRVIVPALLTMCREVPDHPDALPQIVALPELTEGDVLLTDECPDRRWPEPADAIARGRHDGAGNAASPC